MYSKIILIVLAFLALPCFAHAQCYDEDACYKGYVNVKDKDVVIAVNRDNGQVELYWSEKDNSWVKPDAEYQKELQKLHNRKLRMIEAQKEMDERHNETWYDSNVGAGSRGP